MINPPGPASVDIDAIEPLWIGEGCWRRDLPSRPGMRIWVVDMSPGSQWPHVDRHGQGGEDVFILSGSIIDQGQTFSQGTFLSFAPHSVHQPRTETGVRLLGINLADFE
jgi:anti-sigma factor ChrR (cupin superfamily)